jgi:hypothetical protein
MPDNGLGDFAPKCGPAVMAVINGDEQEDLQDMDIDPDSGVRYVDVATPGDSSIWIVDGEPDIEEGDQIQWRVTAPGYDENDLDINPDLSGDFTVGLPSFEFRIWDHDDGTYSDWEEQLIVEADPWESANFIGGVAFGADGRMGTVFLNDATSVPAGSYMIEGIAHGADGRRYVCLWPGDGVVFYRGAIAVRSDGAMVTIPDGDIAARPQGIGMTFRGEVLASIDLPEVSHNGLGLRDSGHLCVEENS